MAILKHKKLTSKRGISLNKDICAFVGLQPGDPVDVTAQDDGTVLIRKHTPKCRFCGDNVKAVKISPSDATVKARLCGIISKELNLKVDPRKDIFKGFSERQGAALIEAIKRYLRSAKRKGAGCGHKQAEG